MTFMRTNAIVNALNKGVKRYVQIEKDNVKNTETAG